MQSILYIEYVIPELTLAFPLVVWTYFGSHRNIQVAVITHLPVGLFERNSAVTLLYVRARVCVCVPEVKAAPLVRGNPQNQIHSRNPPSVID